MKSKKQVLAEYEHEALDRAHSMALILDAILGVHPGIRTDEATKALIAATEAIHDLYQAIGRQSVTGRIIKLGKGAKIKGGKVKIAPVYRDASHAIRAKKSTKQRVVRRKV